MADAASPSDPLASVHRVCSSLACHRDPDSLVTHLVRAIRDEFDLDHVALLTWSRGETTLVCRDYAGVVPSVDLRGLRMPMDRGLVGKALRTRRRVLCNDVLADVDYVEHVRGTRSELTIPLVDGDTPVGVLNIESRRPWAFDESRAKVLDILAERIVPSLANATLFGQLAQAKLEWERTFDAISDPVVLQDADGRVLRANRAFAAACDLSVEDLPGRSTAELVYGKAQPPADDPLAGVQITGEPVSAELDLPELRGRFLLRAFPYHSRHNGVCGVVLILHDVTQKRRMEASAERARRLSALAGLSSSVAHEFNNVMAAIMLRNDLLAQAVKDPGLRRLVKAVSKSASEAASLIRRMLDFARSQGRAESIPVDVNDALRQAVQGIRSRSRAVARGEKSPPRITTALGNLPQVLADPSDLEEILTAVLANAVEATPVGGRVRVRTWHVGRSVRIEVADDGEGIAPEIQSRVFAPFFSTRGRQGAGLGLSIAVGLLRRHRGRIQVNSEPGRGATFTVELPVAPEPQVTPIPRRDASSKKESAA